MAQFDKQRYRRMAVDFGSLQKNHENLADLFSSSGEEEKAEEHRRKANVYSKSVSSAMLLEAQADE